jgi:hypothetical protein
MKRIIVFVALCLLISPSVMAGVDTSSAIVKVYRTYLSLNGDCSDPTVVWNADDSDETAFESVDMNIGPTLGTMTVPATETGAPYKCVIFKMSDEINFVPAANSGAACVAGTSYTINVCLAGTAVWDADNWAAGTDCVTGEDIVWLYISTYSTATAGSPTTDSFVPPTSDGDGDRGHSLSTGSFEVESDGDILTFIFGTDGIVESQWGECDMGPPDFGATVTSGT